MTARTSSNDEQLVAINVTPLVDITLVLLIIFMVTASFVVRQTIEVDMPRDAAPDQAVDAIVNVRIDEKAQIYFDGLLVDEAGLEARIADALAGDTKTSAIITADQGLNYGRVMHLIDVVKSKGIQKFVLSIERPNTVTPHRR